jgi:hypothetical protein
VIEDAAQIVRANGRYSPVKSIRRNTHRPGIPYGDKITCAASHVAEAAKNFLHLPVPPVRRSCRQTATAEACDGHRNVTRGGYSPIKFPIEPPFVCFSRINPTQADHYAEEGHYEGRLQELSHRRELVNAVLATLSPT